MHEKQINVKGDKPFFRKKKGLKKGEMLWEKNKGNIMRQGEIGTIQ
jgi:hypothetical protein